MQLRYLKWVGFGCYLLRFQVVLLVILAALSCLSIFDLFFFFNIIMGSLV